MLMIVKALMAEGLMAEGLVAELTLASQRWTVLLPLMVDKAGMVYGSETTSPHRMLFFTHTHTHTHTHTRARLTHLVYTTAELLRIPHTCGVRVSGMFLTPYTLIFIEHTYKHTMNIIKSGPVLPVSIKTACSIVVTTE